MKQWLLWGFVAFTVVVLVLLVIGVVTHEEPDFTDARNSWDHMPLTVSCKGHVPEENKACGTAMTVVRTVNTRLGFKALKLGGPEADINITMRAPTEVGGVSRDQAGGHFELKGTARVYEHCQIWVMNVSGGASDLEALVLHHELGHCLGLAHDDYEASIMYPAQEITPDLEFPPRMSDWDRDALREKYAGR